MATRKASRKSRGSKLVSKAKKEVRRRRKPDFGDEGRPIDRLGWEILDLIVEPEPPPPGMIVAAMAAVTGPEENLASRRIAALMTRQQQAGPADVLAAPVIAGAPNWVQVGPTAIPNGQSLQRTTFRILVSGRVTDIAVHPTSRSTIYLATARGGVWKTTDGGTSWNALTDNELSLANGAIALAPSDPETLYVGTGEGNLEFYVKTFPTSSSPDNYLGAGMLKSTDGGASWKTQGLAEFTGHGFFRIAVHPTNPKIAFAATSAGLHRTVDGGEHWIQMTNGLPALSPTIIACCDVAIDPSNPSIAYAAFFGDGIYRTANATVANPLWKKLTAGLPLSARRIVLAISPSLPDQVYALFTADEDFGGLFKTTLGTNGATWTAVPVTPDIGGQSSYNLDLNVDPTTPDVLYISALSIYKLTRSGSTWSPTDIGQTIHSDNHCIAFDPADHLTIYAGNDGGIYKSADGGTTWVDGINRGMTITQFEFLDQHPTSDAVVFGGTQDNGTEAYRNSEIFYHADEGDGSFVSIDPLTPENVIHGFFSSGMGRSTQGGAFGSWDWSIGPTGVSPLFYPPFTLDASKPTNIAFGANVVRIDDGQGTKGWHTTVVLPGLSGRVSALNWAEPNRIYAGTTSGQVYKLVKSAGAWTATRVSAPPLPSLWIWDVSTDPASIDTLYVSMAGFGSPHVWRGEIAGAPVWNAISGNGADALPDAPVFAFAIRPGTPNEFYIGTDVGVYQSLNGGSTWSLFNSGLPNTAIYDLKYHAPSDMLRAGTHGRGLWERQLNAPPSVSDVNIYLRDNVMDSARRAPSVADVPAAFADPLRHVALGDRVWWWESADIKIDAPTYQMNVADVNDLTFETKLQHRNAQRGRVARVYVQVHNRGVFEAGGVVVKLLRANVFGGVLPDLPADFWTAFPGDGDQTNWKTIGAAQTTSVLPGRSSILEFDWTPQMTDVEHSCMLVVADCPGDPIPAANKIVQVGQLVQNERRVTQLNLRVVDPPPASADPVVWTTVSLAGDGSTKFDVAVRGTKARRILVALPKKPLAQLDPARFDGAAKATLSVKTRKALNDFLAANFTAFELADVFEISAGGASLRQIKPPANKPLEIVVGVASSAQPARVTIAQAANGAVRGGCTIAMKHPK